MNTRARLASPQAGDAGGGSVADGPDLPRSRRVSGR